MASLLVQELEAVERGNLSSTFAWTRQELKVRCSSASKRVLCESGPQLRCTIERHLSCLPTCACLLPQITVRLPRCRFLQCRLKFYALVCGALAREEPDLLLKPRRASWRPAPPRQPRWAPAWASLRELGAEIENNLALMTRLLHHSQSLSALALSQHMAKALGWDWQGQGAHLTALGGGFAPCWGQVALLATMLDADAPDPGKLRCSALRLRTCRLQPS